MCVYVRRVYELCQTKFPPPFSESNERARESARYCVAQSINLRMCGF